MQANREHIEQFYDYLNHSPNGVTEIRVINVNSGSILWIGYFDNRDDFVCACMSINDGNIYASLNPAPREFLSRAPNHLICPRDTVRDEHIEYVNNILIDIDPARPSRTASTDEERDLTISKSYDIEHYLIDRGLCSSDQIVRAMSGNGSYVLLAIPPIVVNDDNRATISAKLRTFNRDICEQFSDDRVNIDSSTYTLSHLVKVIGTVSRKGDDTPDRPHRVSYPMTGLVRNESDSLRQYILDIEFPEPTIHATRTATHEPPSYTPPDNLNIDHPCDMCSAAVRLWNARDVSDRSVCIFVMMRILVAKGLPRDEAIEYTQYYDSELGGKYTSRHNGGIVEFDRMYNKITRHDSVTVPCRWLRNRYYCSDEDASRCHDPNRVYNIVPRYRRVPVSSEEVRHPTITLEQAREQLRNDINAINNNRSSGPHTYLLRYPSGVGKTRMVAGYIRNSGLRTIWLDARHDYARETINNYLQGINVIELASRYRMLEDDTLHCIRSDQIRRISSEDPTNIGRVCDRCSIRYTDCEYYNARHEVYSNDTRIIVGMHAHLQVTDLRDYRADIIVFDEDCSRHYREEHKFSRNDISRSIKVLSGIEDSATLVKYLQHLLSIEEEVFTISPLGDISDEFMDQYNNVIRGIYNYINVVRILQDINGHTIVRRGETFTYVDTMQLPQLPGYTYVRTAPLPDIDTIILDACGSREFYERLLGREVIVYGGDCHIEQAAHITQFIEGAYPKRSFIYKCRVMSTYHRVRSLIDAIIQRHAGQRILIIAHSNVKEKLKEKLIDDGIDVDMEHYYNTSGVDQYRDHDVLIVVGIPMIGYRDIVYNTSRQFDLNWTDARIQELANEISSNTYVRLDYSDGSYGYEVAIYSSPDPRIQLFYEHTVLAELAQAIGRIRPYEPLTDGRNKHVYIITNQPSGYRPDRVITIGEFMQDEAGNGCRLTSRRTRWTSNKVMERIRVITEAIIDMPNEFTVAQLADRLGYTTKSQRDELRRTLRRKHEDLGIIIDGHTIRKATHSS